MTLSRPLAVALAWVVAVVGVLGVVRAVVVMPEGCPAVSPDRARAAAEEAVAWFARNQAADGRWAYRYDRGADTVDRRDHVVRHSGVALSLYQADAAGLPDARAVGDRGVAWSLDQLARRGDWAAVRSGDDAPTGASALLVAALATRRLATGDPRWDDHLDRLGRFLVEMTEDTGAVLARYDLAAGRPAPGEYSVFFTGEAYFALALLDRVDPDGGWRPTVDRIGTYIATERDDAEGRWPTTPDHWAAYGLDVARGDGELDDRGRAYLRDLAPAFGVQVRWESQRTGRGLNRWALRGVPGLGAAVGTLGEGLGGLWRASEGVDGLGAERAAIGDRLRCVAGLLVDRQVTAAEAEETGAPGLARGAWFRLGVTQMDDQQHALSALLAALPALDESDRVTTQGRTEAPPAHLLWLLAIAAAVTNPPRLHRALGDAHRRRTTTSAALAAAGLAALAAIAGPLARATAVSGTTALVAAGMVAALTAGIDASRRPPPLQARLAEAEHAPGPTAQAALGALVIARPATVLLTLAIATEHGVAAGLPVALAAAATGLAPLARARAWWPDQDRARTAVAVVALVGAADVILHGILGI